MQTPEIQAFLDLIAWSEGTSTHPLTKNDGYDVIVTGWHQPPEIFTDYSDHPFAGGRAPVLVNPNANPPLKSDASGRYQQMLRYWPAYRAELALPDFGPDSQDRVAVQLLHEVGAIEAIVAGGIDFAIHFASERWASFPGNDYHQPEQRMQALLTKYAELLAVRKAAANGQ